MNITINGKTYEFKAGMRFIREINSKAQQKANGLTENIGFEVRLLQVQQGDPEALVDILLTANKDFEPRLTAKELEDYIENDCEDIEGLFDQTIDFLSRSSCCRVKVKKILERQKQNQNQ